MRNWEVDLALACWTCLVLVYCCWIFLDTAVSDWVYTLHYTVASFRYSACYTYSPNIFDCADSLIYSHFYCEVVFLLCGPDYPRYACRTCYFSSSLEIFFALFSNQNISFEVFLFIRLNHRQQATPPQLHFLIANSWCLHPWELSRFLQCSRHFSLAINWGLLLVRVWLHRKDFLFCQARQSRIRWDFLFDLRPSYQDRPPTFRWWLQQSTVLLQQIQPFRFNEEVHWWRQMAFREI